MKDPDKLWFNTPNTETLCRGGGNGPNHPTQLYAIKKYVKNGMSLLDIGCGSASTYEAISKEGLKIWYKGVDMIPKNIEWCKKTFPEAWFQIEDAEHLNEDGMSWDVAYSRHVVDHMPLFESAVNEHCRVARKLVIVVLWVPFSDKDEHEIKPIDYRPSGGLLYPTEFTNQYSRKKVHEYIESKKDAWDLLELTEEVGTEVSGHDIVLVLQRKEV